MSVRPTRSMTHTDQGHLVARVIAGGLSLFRQPPTAYGKNARLGRANIFNRQVGGQPSTAFSRQT
jgi:hypothetical protein